MPETSTDLDDLHVNKVKDAVWSCKSIKQLDYTTDFYRPWFNALRESPDPHHKTMAKHISNMVAYQRNMLAKDDAKRRKAAG